MMRREREYGGGEKDIVEDAVGARGGGHCEEGWAAGRIEEED